MCQLLAGCYLENVQFLCERENLTGHGARSVWDQEAHGDFLIRGRRLALDGYAF